MNSEEKWKTLLEKLHENDKDFPTFGITNIKPKYFYAYIKGNLIIIENAKHEENSCSISTKRKIDIKQFEGVFEKFEDYISGVKGVRQTLRDSAGQNTTCTISLIKHILYP